LDSLGSLSSFDTKVQLTDVPLVMNVRGRVDGPDLHVKLQSGELTHELRFPLPRGGLVANDLFPEAKLLDLKVGRRWQEEIFSPFKASMDIVQAEVVAEGLIDHRDGRQNAKRVEYRMLSSSGVAADNTLRSVIWVADDGRVLRQELHLMSVTLRFERRSEPRLIERARKLLDLDTYATVAPSQQSQQ
jgi:hypothetical protein